MSSPRRWIKAMLKIPTEHNEQVSLFNWAWTQRRQYPELDLLFAVPNGGQRRKRTAGMLRAEGVKSGIPDVVLPVPRNGYHGAYLEMKRTKGGVVSEDQKKWIECLRAQGYFVAVCKGWVEAKDVLVNYLTAI